MATTPDEISIPSAHFNITNATLCITELESEKKPHHNNDSLPIMHYKYRAAR